MPGIKDAKTILIIGATAGIGRSLAYAIHDLPTEPTVIVAGRRQDRIDEITQKSGRFGGITVDLLAGREALKKFTEDVIVQWPELDAVIFCSAVQHVYHFNDPSTIDLDLLDAEINTNYISMYTLITYFIPHFLSRSDKGLHSFLIPVTSTLATLPAAVIPGYSASKAAVHSLVLSLNDSLKNTNVHVMELVPPLTESELHDHQGTRDFLSKRWMPLDEFTKEALAGLIEGGLQIPVGNARPAWTKFETGKAEAMADPNRKT